MAILGSVPSAPAEAKLDRASFTGSASEYFGIWIVNVFLTIITFGIYSAWAKVRRKRYFYGNTVILDRSFEYHATGLQIFIGRLIVFVFLILINVASTFFPLFGILLSLLIVLALPLLVKRSLRFNARVTSYRNVRFDFVGSTGGAFVAVLLGGLVAFLSLGILAPLASRWLWRYIFNNYRYGDRPFSADPRLGDLYRVWILPAILFVLGAMLAGLMFAAVIAGIDSINDAGLEASGMESFSFWHWNILLMIVLYILAGIFYRVGVRNVVWSSALLDGRHRLMSDLSRRRYAWIVVSNTVVTLLSFGLMRPWAAVRMARYVNEHSGIRVDGDPGEILSSIESTGAAISAEYMDMEGVDFGL